MVLRPLPPMLRFNKFENRAIEKFLRLLASDEGYGGAMVPVRIF